MKSRRFKAVILILLVGGLALVAYNMFRKRPVEFRVTVHYGRAAAAVREASLEVFRLRDDTLVSRKAWHYKNGARDDETAKLRMAIGRYRFVVRLEFEQGVRSTEREVDARESADLMLDVSNLAP